MRFSSVLLSGLSLFAFPVAALAQEQSGTSDVVSTNVGRVEVQGAGEQLGSGYMVREDAGKARSTVTAAGIANSIPTSNPYQDINLLPGVVQGQDDALGLSGGTLTIRGLRSDQIGFTINGAPVNDSGNFAVYPQEYVDSENLDQIFVTQGSTDTEAPHVGASGGNIGIVSRAPSDKFGARLVYTGGGYADGVPAQLSRPFIRLDSGYLGDFKGFVSFSQTDADKWRGLGDDDRFHTDGQVYYRIGDTGHASFNWVYNKARDDFYRQIGRTTISGVGESGIQSAGILGDNFDYDTFWGQPGYAVHLTPGAGTQDEGASVVNPNYPSITTFRSNDYKLQVNPFEDAVLTGDISLQLTQALSVDVAPYFWYGTGGGGFGLADDRTTATSSTHEGYNTFGSHADPVAPGYGYLLPDLNGDGDLSDTILLYRSSVTRTNRPGVNVRANYDINTDMTVAVGAWYERARHRQTQPYSYVLADGSPCDAWLNGDLQHMLNDACVVKDASGRVIQGRDQTTISEDESLWGTFTGAFDQERIRVNAGLAWRQLTRDGEGRLPIPILDPASPFYNAEAKHPSFVYSELLPSFSISYQPADSLQLFADVSRNFRAPANYVYFNYNTGSLTFAAPTTIGGHTYAAGTWAPGTVWLIGNNVNPEVTWAYEAGLRTHQGVLNGSVTAFLNNISNYQATAQIDGNQKTTINIGRVTTYGLEAEVGTSPWHGFTFYGSATLQNSEVADNVPVSLVAGVINHAPTKGRQLTDVPNWIIAASIGYSNGGFFANVNPKCVGARWATLVNDEQAPSYCLVDATIGYHFDQHATLRLFASNLFNQTYIAEINTNATGTSGAFNSFAATTVEGNTLSPGSISVTPGAPAFVGASVTYDF
jgi:iron complex outermembrane receptor protein